MSFKEKRTDLIQQNNNHRTLTLKLDVAFGVLLGITSIVITFIEELNSMCRKRGHPQVHCSILMLSGGQIRHGMCCCEVALAIIGTLTVARNYLGRGPVSPSSLC